MTGFMDKFLSGTDDREPQGDGTGEGFASDAPASETQATAAPPSAEPEAAASDPGETPGAGDAQEDDLETRVIAALRTVYDPEIPVNIYDLGLIYDLDVDADGDVKIRMTLTSPMCPVADILPQQVENVVLMTEGVRDVDLELVWEPPWHPGRLTDDVKLELGLL